MHKTEETAKESRLNFMYSHLRNRTLADCAVFDRRPINWIKFNVLNSDYLRSTEVHGVNPETWMPRARKSKTIVNRRPNGTRRANIMETNDLRAFMG